jgi:hypothetical protein
MRSVLRRRHYRVPRFTVRRCPGKLDLVGLYFVQSRGRAYLETAFRGQKGLFRGGRLWYDRGCQSTVEESDREVWFLVVAGFFAAIPLRLSGVVR